MSRRRRIAPLALGAAVALALSAGNAFAEPSNKWRIEIDNDAASAGALVFELAPVSGMPVGITVQVPAGTGENDVAALVRDALLAHLGSDYRVELDDGEDVLIKKQDGAADFDLRLLQQTVSGVRVELERE